MPLPAARALCSICPWQDAVLIANRIALLALGARGFPEKTAKKAAKVVPAFCREEQGETRYYLLSLVRQVVLVKAQPGRHIKKNGSVGCFP